MTTHMTESRLAADSGRRGAGAPRRIGSVSSLNGVPLTWGIESDVVFTSPARLSLLLARGELDAALLSVSEAILRDTYVALDGVGVASDGDVQSVILAHQVPLERVETVWCDPASLASVNLLKVLLAERGLRPHYRPLGAYRDAAACDAVLLIGNQALDFVRRGAPHRIWDLGGGWREQTGLPFVFALWTLRREAAAEPLRNRLRAAHRHGMDSLDEIITQRPEYDLEFRRAYFQRHLQFSLGPEHRRGIECFAALLDRHGLGPAHPVCFVT